MSDIVFRPTAGMFSFFFIMSGVFAVIMLLAAVAGVIVERRRVGRIPPHVRRRQQAQRGRAKSWLPLVVTGGAILFVLSPLSYPLMHYRDEIHLGNDELKLASGRVIPLRTAVLWTQEVHGRGRNSWSCTWFMTTDHQAVRADDDFWRFQTATGETVRAHLAAHYGVVQQSPPFTACTLENGVVKLPASDSVRR